MMVVGIVGNGDQPRRIAPGSMAGTALPKLR